MGRGPHGGSWAGPEPSCKRKHEQQLHPPVSVRRARPCGPSPEARPVTSHGLCLWRVPGSVSAHPWRTATRALGPEALAGRSGLGGGPRRGCCPSPAPRRGCPGWTRRCSPPSGSCAAVAAIFTGSLRLTAESTFGAPPPPRPRPPELRAAELPRTSGTGEGRHGQGTVAGLALRPRQAPGLGRCPSCCSAAAPTVTRLPRVAHLSVPTPPIRGWGRSPTSQGVAGRSAPGGVQAAVRRPPRAGAEHFAGAGTLLLEATASVVPHGHTYQRGLRVRGRLRGARRGTPGPGPPGTQLVLQPLREEGGRRPWQDCPLPRARLTAWLWPRAWRADPAGGCGCLLTPGASACSQRHPRQRPGRGRGAGWGARGAGSRLWGRPVARPWSEPWSRAPCALFRPL